MKVLYKVRLVPTVSTLLVEVETAPFGCGLSIGKLG